MNIAQKSLGLEPIIKMLNQLGTHGMSSDESDGPTSRYSTGTHHRTYRIRLRLDRPQWLTNVLRMLDSLHYERRQARSRSGGSTQGSPTRLRIEGDRLSQSIAVRGLPENFYDPVWLQALGPEQRYELAVKDPAPYAVPSHYLRCVFYLHVLPV